MNNLVISAMNLNNWVTRVLVNAGLNTSAASIISHNIIQAEMRGVKSHGLLLLPIYVRRILSGGINTKYDFKVIRDTGPIVVLDGDNGPGQVVATEATSIAINRASKYGISNVCARNSNHIGMLATYGIQIADSKLVGIIMTNSSPWLSAHGSRKRRIGNNAICFAIPSSPHALIFDMATGTVATGKIKFAALHKNSIPENWLYDKNGVPTTDPKNIAEGSIIPFGGYKGYGLSVIIDVLTSIISGGTPSLKVSSQEIESQPTSACHSFLVINPSMFEDYDYFTKAVAEYMIELRKTIPTTENIPVIVPGDPELHAYSNSITNGIVVTQEILHRINEVAALVGSGHLE